MNSSVTRVDLNAPPEPLGTGAKQRSAIFLQLAQQGGILLVLIALCAFFATQSPYFLTAQNFANIGRELPYIAILAFGVTFAMLAGEIDISVGSVLSFTGVCAALLLDRGVALLPAVLLCVLAATAIGVVNGALVVFGKVSSLLITLGTLSVVAGLTITLSGGTTLAIESPGLSEAFATSQIGPIPVPILIAAAVLIVCWAVLRLTSFGWNVYATGGNRIAAELAGIPTGAVRIGVMAICAALAGFAGIMLAARLSSGVPTAGSGLELTAIAAVVLGGTSFVGGRGGVMLTVLGVLVLVVLQNGLTLMEIGYQYNLMITGLVIVVAVILDRFARERRK